MHKERLEVFSMAKVCMDTYRRRYNEAKKKKEERFTNLKKNYLPGSPMFIQERDRIQPEYEAEIESARDEAMQHFEDTLSKAVAREKAAAMAPGMGTKPVLEGLKLLENIPISVDEFNAMTEQIGGKQYWTDRYFEHLADKNGISKTGIQPSLTVKLSVLEELAVNTRDFINEYDAETKNFYITSSDKYIFDLEEKYTNGYAGIYLNDQEQAERMVSKALNRPDSMERACVLSNMLRTAEPELQTEMLSILAESDSAVLSDPSMKLTNVQKTVDQFKQAESERIKAADMAMERISGTKSHQDLIGTIYDNLDNRHFVKAIEKKINETSSKELKQAYDHMRELKLEDRTRNSENYSDYAEVG